MPEGGDDTGDIMSVVVIIVIVAVLLLIVFFISLLFMPLREVLGGIAEGVVNSVMLPLMTFAIASNPDIYLFKNIVGDIIKIMSLIYIVGIILSGMYIVLVSSSPVERARAKSIILRLIFGLVLLTVSLQAYAVLMDVSSSLTLEILSGAKLSGASFFVVGNSTIAGVLINTFMSVFMIVFVLPVLVVALATLGLRYVAAALFGILFPITITLYFIEVTRGIGANLMRYTLMVMLTQPATAIVFYITIMSLNAMGELSPSDPVPALTSMLIGMAGFLLVALTPLIMLDIMKWFGGALAGTGMMVAYDRPTAGGAMVALGGYAAGMGPEALVVGYSMRTLGDHALGEKADSERMLAVAKKEIAMAKKAGWDPNNPATDYLRPNLSTDYLRQVVSEAKHHPSGLSWRQKLFMTREEKLYEKALGSGIDSTHGKEIASAESMLPAPVEAVIAGLDEVKDAVNRVVKGTGEWREEIRSFNTRINSAQDARDVAAATKDLLVQSGMTDSEATQWAASIENSSDLNAARDKGRAAVVYNRIRQDGRFRGLHDDFFRGIREDIQSGDTDAINMDNVANRIKEFGKHQEALGTGWSADDTDKLVNNYIKDYKYYYNRYGEKGQIFSVVGSYKGSVMMNAANMSPAEIANYEAMFGELGTLGFALDLGANMHGRMLLEDYMGTGPRPSQFYSGLGPDTQAEWEAEQKAKRKENDEHTWETV